MAISDKLNYLIETKQLFKDRLNSLGAEITSSTTFRNYLTWLDTFYGEVSNKTDLSQNGVVGRTSQDSTTGKNLFNKLDYTQITTNGNGSPTNIVKQNDYISFTSSGSTNFSGLYIPNNSVTNYIDNFNTSTNYYISFDVTVDKACKFGGGQTTTYIDIPIGKTRVSFYGTITGTINFYVRNAITDGVNVKIENIMVSTESDTTYEPYTYGASPNPDYPQPINNLSGDVPYKVSGKNLFDKNSISNNEWLLVNGTTESHNDFCVSDYIPIKENTDYYLPMTNTRRLKYYNSEKQPLTTSDWDIERSTVGQVITTPNNANYVRITIQYTVVDINTFQFEQGSTTTSYEPYISQTFNIPLGDIELCKIGDYKDFIKKGTGKNLCGIPNQSFNFNGVDITIEDGTITLNGTATTTETAYLQPIKTTTLKGTYTNNIIYISGTDPGSSFGNFNLRKESDSSVIQGSQANLYSNNSNSTITIEEDTNIIFGIYIRKNNVYTNYKFRPQLVKTATADYNYEPYGMYGKWYLEKNINKVVLNGSESWQYISVTQGSLFRNNDTITNDINDNTYIPYSNNYKGIAYNNYLNRANNQFYIQNQNDFLDIIDNRYTSASDFKTWLSSNNLLVYYILNTPTTTEITQENYPSLYNALKQIQDYLTAYKINKEFILGYSSPEIEY